MESKDYKNRTYLSAIESAKYLNVSVEMLHALANRQVIKVEIAASGQMRFDIRELKKYETNLTSKHRRNKINIDKVKYKRYLPLPK